MIRLHKNWVYSVEYFWSLPIEWPACIHGQSIGLTFFSHCIEWGGGTISLDLQQQGHTSQCPLGSLLFGLEVEGPDERGTALLGLVDGTLVDVPCILLVNGNSLDEDDRHVGGEFLEAGFRDQVGLRIPASAFHVQSMNVGTLSGCTAEVLPVLLGDVALQAHLVQGPLVLARHGLHDGRQETLRVEEAAEPHHGRESEVGGPLLQLLDAEEEIGVPGAQAVETGVGTLDPCGRDLVQEEGVTQFLHVCGDGQLTLSKTNGEN